MAVCNFALKFAKKKLVTVSLQHFAFNEHSVAVLPCPCNSAVEQQHVYTCIAALVNVLLYRAALSPAAAAAAARQDSRILRPT